MRSSEGFILVRPGLHLYTRVIGDGPEVVLVPNANWLAELLLPLAEERTLIFFDPRSRGRSSAVTDSRQLSLEDDVADLEMVRRFYGVDRASLIGHSYHAAMTALYALEYPRRVERLLQVCPITPRRPGEWALETPSVEELAFPPGIPRLDELRRAGIDREDPVTYCRAWFHSFLLPAQMGDLTAAPLFPIEDVSSFPNEWPEHALAVYFEHILPKMGSWDFRPRLAGLDLPVLVLQGDEDLVPIQASRDWAASCPDGRFLAIEGAGHHPYIERPQEFFPAAEAFLRGGWPAGAETVRGGLS